MNKTFSTNRFMSLAEEYMIYGTSDEEIAKIDMTEEFWKEIEIEIRDNELVDINVNAKVRMGKSTTAIALGQKIFELIKKHKKRDGGSFGISNIARDQQEYSKMMRDPETRNTVIVTDEINELEETGENVTVEKALNNVFSNVQAVRYVHRICCSPKGVTDPNADVFLEIISVDRKKKLTHAYLYYNLFKKGFSTRQLLGHITIEVGDLIKEWDKICDIFNKTEKNNGEEKKIKRAREKDFYVEYMVRKCEKNELITKENILRPRILEYAEVILEVEDKLRKIAQMKILTRETVKNYIKKTSKENGIPTSIVGEELMTQEVIGVLSLWKEVAKTQDLINREKKKDKLDKETVEKIRSLEEVESVLMNGIHEQLETYRRYKELNKKYHSTVSNGPIINGVEQ